MRLNNKFVFFIYYRFVEEEVLIQVLGLSAQGLLF